MIISSNVSLKLGFCKVLDIFPFLSETQLWNKDLVLYQSFPTEKIISHITYSRWQAAELQVPVLNLFKPQNLHLKLSFTCLLKRLFLQYHILDLTNLNKIFDVLLVALLIYVSKKLIVSC